VNYLTSPNVNLIFWKQNGEENDENAFIYDIGYEEDINTINEQIRQNVLFVCTTYNNRVIEYRHHTYILSRKN